MADERPRMPSSQAAPASLSEESLDRARNMDDEEKSQSSISPAGQNGTSDSQVHDKESRTASLELTRTVSNAISSLSTRVTNRHIVDPGPPPDGGLKAWTQVAMAWVIIVTTWGYLNSFGVFQTYYTTASERRPIDNILDRFRPTLGYTIRICSFWSSI